MVYHLTLRLYVLESKAIFSETVLGTSERSPVQEESLKNHDKLFKKKWT